MTKHMGVICGSLRKNSYNRTIGEAVIEMDDSAAFHWIEIQDLPLFNEDLEADLPEAVTAFTNALRAVDGVIILTPEYNSGMPGALKNALDWASRPPRASVMNQKPVGIIGATPGGFGTAFAQMQLRQVLEAMQARVFPLQKVYISQVHEKVDIHERELKDEKTKQYLQQYVKSFANWLDTITTK
ncbi:NAD(P)H-dependent oxidoreductase [Ectobacillus sp. JY-23]|uniref:NADPH-dependent FMN reductase n=1 Tax=Ectobacillus sp. JY-23 TaxID=2933872 RepID=UPI001FF42B2C|nr:NADPH-dependent FMN reductase [Ectobacillus sp. JY-23]UOY92356.1 NAD(P)H-dependent oxidoreductase [Ectobacillus sp. JY-23]